MSFLQMIHWMFLVNCFKKDKTAFSFQQNTDGIFGNNLLSSLYRSDSGICTGDFTLY